MHLGGFTDDLGRGQRAATNDGQQRRCNDRDAFGDLGGQLVDLGGEHPQVLDEPQGQSVHQRVVTVSFKVGSHGVESAGAVNLCRWRPPGVEFMQMPAQPGDDPGALSNEVLAVIDQQPQLAFDTVEAGHRQIRLAQGLRIGEGRVGDPSGG